MSYILDALRRADAERARGAVPGLHDQPLAARTPSDTVAAQRRLPPWVWVAGTLAAVTVVALAAWAWWRPAQGSVPRKEVAPVVTEAASPAAPAVPSPVPVESPAPRLPMPGLSAAPPRVVKPIVPPPVVERAEPPATAASKASPVPRLARLPDSVRHELPALKVGGSMYSDSAASRILVLDGQMLHEGSTVVPGLVLERIGPTSARLRWHDQPFELPY